MEFKGIGSYLKWNGLRVVIYAREEARKEPCA